MCGDFMLYKTLGPSGMQVSLLGYGGWALGKKGWPGVDEKEALKTLEACIGQGINFFDTAPVYGFGRSEELIGETLAGIRPQIIIATKCGLRWDDRGRIKHNLTGDSIRWELEQSLRRLKTDYIDLYQIHWPDRHTPLEETLETLTALNVQGVIRHIGLSNFSPQLLKKALTLAAIVSVQQPYNMLQREAEAALLPLCSQLGIGFICYSPLAQGLLGGSLSEDFKPGRHDVRRLNPLYRNRETFQAAIALVKNITPCPAAQSLAFAARQEAVSTLLVSMTRRAHLVENSRTVSGARDR
jgi:aryl-alcohol dehydrogenase-like predicted oxidoreductase